jgi:hypothetical protein
MRLPAILLLLATLLLSSPACGEKRETILDTDGSNAAVGPPVTRSDVILTADKYARLHWTMSMANRTGTSCGGYFASTYPAGNRIGMGYKWGGWNDIDDFMEKIADGYGTGTGGGANTYEYFSIDCVVGVSCTGFVSRAWHLYQKYTLCYPDPDIPRKFCEICQDIEGVDFVNRQLDALKKGDAFINDYHTILFVYETRDGKPMVMDSSIEGVRFRQLTWDYLASEGYKAIRYDNITERTNPLGTIVNPIAIDSDEFPFTHDGNTRDVISMEFDRYSAEPTVLQVGPEVVYTLQMRSPGTVTLIVTDIKHEGIDNDIHLLGSLQRNDVVMMATDCIERADIAITRELDAGPYFVIIDSSSDAPGEYRLIIDSQ